MSLTSWNKCASCTQGHLLMRPTCNVNSSSSSLSSLNVCSTHLGRQIGRTKIPRTKMDHRQTIAKSIRSASVGVSYVLTAQDCSTFKRGPGIGFGDPPRTTFCLSVIQHQPSILGFICSLICIWCLISSCYPRTRRTKKKRWNNFLFL